MGPRRSHRKSRNGCPECKTRRVKCDERYPCTNCVKHGIPCSYVAPIDTHDTPTSSASSAAQSPAHVRTEVYSHSQSVSHPDNSPWGLANADIAESPNRSGLLEILPRSSQDAPTLKEDWR
ncbi:hypothetical protein PENDEC_c001G05072 [Penicillium decumbens]|uniref:Zn(2)-C6 fungal-type domain-containing protein n=1 Tax=Penicillium decumbens TaxID=69771 RepID=A0A1V6PME4_PENDC|nr:hypothetical protein PENDEC_c001G05072 [Penicillium decumbens]